jgi:plastocyanin
VKRLTLLAITAFTGAGCSSPAPRRYEVAIKNFTFEPAQLTVAVGDTIVWSNTDFVPHTATARDSTWDSNSINGSNAWRFVANAPGAHEYYCVFHPTMRATIVVR